MNRPRYLGSGLNPRRYEDTPPPTDEQAHIFEQVKGTDANIMINALAGTGKTTTLEMMEAIEKEKPSLYLVFNKRNAEEAKKRMKSTTSVRTFNSLGHSIWASYLGGKVTMPPRKMDTLYREMIDEVKSKETRDLMWVIRWEVLNACSRAKAVGYVPEGKYPAANHLCPRGAFHAQLEERPDDLVCDLTDALLHRSIQAAYKGAIDFDDQLYMPTLFGGPFPKFPLVKVDEYQDLSPINHAMLDKLVTRRIIGVGDPWQNIYGFRGAKQGGMGAAKEKFKMTECDLSISFRCPSAIVEAAQWRVPHFKWFKEGGHVETLEQLGGNDIPDNSTFICRNNAPLFRLAFELLSSGRSVRVAGSDIGPKIVGIMRKLGDGNTGRKELLSLIEDWRDDKLSRESTTANDIADCMRVFASFASTLDGAVSYAEHLFKQEGKIQLLTGHKAKGLEFPRVYLLDTFLLGEHEQDLNLRYVMQTRSSDQLYEIDHKRIKIERINA